VTSENWFEVIKLAMDTNNPKLKQKALSVIPSTIPSQHLFNLCLQLIEENQSLSQRLSNTEKENQSLSQRLSNTEKHNQSLSQKVDQIDACLKKFINELLVFKGTYERIAGI